MSDLNTPGNWWEKIQQVEFESLYTGLREIDDVSQLQSKLTIEEGSVNAQIPLFKSFGFYTNADLDPLRNKSSKEKQNFKIMFPGFWTSGEYLDHKKIKWDLFKIKKCIGNNSVYLFISDLWYVFSVQKEEFDTVWFMAESLKMIQEPQWQLSWVFNFSSNNWKVEYYLNWVLEWTLDGSCFTCITWDISESFVYVWHKSYIYKSVFRKIKDNVTKKDMLIHDDGEGIDLELWEIKKLALDPQQNLLFVVSENEEWISSLHILDHKKLFNSSEAVVQEIKTIEGVVDINILSNWDIILSKSNETTEIINTNLNTLQSIDWWSFEMKKIKVNKATNQTKKHVLDALWWFTLSLDSEGISNEWNEQDREIIKQLREKPVDTTWKTLIELFDEAETEEDIKLVYDALHQIEEKFPEIHDLLQTMKRQINDKRNKIVLAFVFSELDDIASELWWVSDLATLITIKEKLKSIQKKRRNIAAWVVEKDKELKELLEIVNQKIKDYQEAHKEELEQEIEDNLVRIKEILDDIDNAIDVSSIIESEIYKTTYDMIYNLEPSLQSTYKKKLNDLILARKKTIWDIRKQEKEQEQQLIERNKNEILENIELIRDILEDIDDIVAVEQYEQNDALVQKVREQLSQIPSAEAQKLELKMKNIIRERIFSLRLNGFETKWVIQNLDSYGIDTVLYYEEDWTEQVEWKIEWKEKPDWKISIVVKLMNGETHEYDKSLYLKDFEKYWSLAIWDKWIKFDMTDEEFAKFAKSLSKWKEWVWEKELKWLREKLVAETDADQKQKLKQQLKEKREYYKDARYAVLLVNRLIKQQKLNPRSKVPPFDPDYIVLDEEKDILKELSARLVDQKHNSWIEILEWWPWLWKTVMCEFLAQVTNREIIRVQCSKMDPSDMFFSPTLKKWETSREPADWIKLMQKPGTIILFDEIDKLNDQCFERLHSLFDKSRSVYDPQLWKFKANPDCLFLWTRNSYDRLSNPIISRWRILQINYPGELNESYKISKYADNPILKKLPYEEFVALYEKYIIRKESVPTNVQEKNIYNLIINIKHLLGVFTELRKQYDSVDAFKYELSYRDARQIFVDYNWWADFKKAVENVLIPKARAAVVDKDEKAEQEEMVRRAIGEVMW